MTDTADTSAPQDNLDPPGLALDIAAPVQDTPAKRALKSAKKSLDAAREAADHAADALRHGREAMPEVSERAASALDAHLERLATGDAAAWPGNAPQLEDPLDDVRVVIRDQVRQRPIASALTAVGLGLILGLAMRGGRR